MKMTSFAAIAAAVAGLAIAAAGPASAQYAFGYSQHDGGETLTLGTGSGPLVLDTNGFQGWVSTGYANTAGPDSNTNYIVGDLGGGNLFNDFFVFDISRLTGPVSSVTLSLNPQQITAPLTFRLGGANQVLGSLYDAASPDSSLYTALESGRWYGLFGLDPNTSFGGPLSFSLNGNAIADLNADIANGDQYFAIGGTVDPAAPVPEPAAWAMMLTGIAGLGAAMRSRRRPALSAAA